MNYLFSNQNTVTLKKKKYVTVLEYIFIKHIVYQTILYCYYLYIIITIIIIYHFSIISINIYYFVCSMFDFVLRI